MRLRYVALFAFFAGMNSSAVAQNARFEECDGYRPPRGNWDGMSSRATLFGGRGSEPEREQPSLSGNGVEACTSALTDPALVAAFGQRRASLLQARAMHRVAAGDRPGALADLELADQAIGEDPYGRRSLGLGTRLLRAFVQLDAGERVAAAENARAIIDAREFEPGLGLAAAQIHLAATRDWATYTMHVRRFARTNPALLISLFAIASTRGNFSEAVEIYPQIVISTPRNRGGYQIQDLLQRRVQNMSMAVDLGGAYAYALAAIGRREDADAAIAAARTTLELAIAPPQPPAGRTQPTSEQRREHEAFVRAGSEAAPMIERWHRLVRLRGLVDAGNAQAAIADLVSGGPIGTDGASLDFVRALARSSPRETEELAPVIATMEQTIAASLSEMTEPKVGNMLNALPEAENANTSPTLRSMSEMARLWNGNDDGYRAGAIGVGGVRTIRFASRRGSVGSTAEMALLSAAWLARQSGSAGLLVLDKRQMTRTIVTTTIYGGAVGSQANGQEVEIDVMFVDPSALPAAYASARWRVLDVGAVIEALSPIYRSAPQGP